MSSPLLALFARSLREDVRTRMTYLARTGLVLVILLFVLTTRQSLGWGNAPGLRFFGTVIYINFAFIVLAGLSYFASAITEEKEEATLGLLRMTNLDPLSILLGKSTSRLIGALLLLVAQLPFTLLAISLGGVAVRQIFAAYCTLGAFLVFLANLALLASVIFRRGTAAAVFTGLTLFGFFAVVPLLRFFAMIPVQVGLIKTQGPLLVWLGKAADFVALASPLSRLNSILRTGFAEPPAGMQVWTNLALGAGCFLLAWLVFEWFCSEQGEAAPGRAVLRNKGRSALGAPGRAWSEALAWKDFHFLTGGKVWMAVKFGFYALPLLGVALIPRYWWRTTSFEALGYFTIWLMLLIACLELAFMAASIFRQERKWKTLSSLAMLPMSTRRMAYQKLLGCIPALIPAAFYFTFGVICVSDDLLAWLRDLWRGDRYHFFEGDLFLGIAYAFFQGVLFLHLVVWLSLYLKRGALPLAIAIHFVAHMFLGIVMGAVMRDGQAMLFVLALMSAAASAVLHVLIGGRLEDLAAED
jgi:hypothetical protein